MFSVSICHADGVGDDGVMSMRSQHNMMLAMLQHAACPGQQQCLHHHWHQWQHHERLVNQQSTPIINHVHLHHHNHLDKMVWFLFSHAHVCKMLKTLYNLQHLNMNINLILGWKQKQYLIGFSLLKLFLLGTKQNLFKKCVLIRPSHEWGYYALAPWDIITFYLLTRQ